MQLRAISIRQPWAHAVVRLGKDVENRGRATSHRGLVLIHASAGMGTEEWADAAEFMHSINVMPPARSAVDRGGIVGVAELVDCVRQHTSPWFFGPVGLVLRNARPLPFTPCRGTVTPMCWSVPANVADRLSGLV
jgi:hypothetical protein